MPRYEFVLNETACCGAPIVIEYRDGNLYPTAAVIESKLRAGRPTQMVHPCAVSAIMHVSSAYILAGESSRGVVKKEVEPLQREGSGRVAQCEATGNQSVLAWPTGAGPDAGVADRAPCGGNPALILFIFSVM